jgi:cytoskeletal protein RodZ
MNSSIAGFLELALVFGGLLAFLIWELFSVKRAQREDAEKATSQDPTTKRSAAADSPGKRRPVE